MDKAKKDQGVDSSSPSNATRRRQDRRGLLGWLFGATKGLIIAVSFSVMFLVALTHTVGWAFDLTDMILRKGLGLSTLSAQATSEVSELRLRIETLENEVKTTKRQLSSSDDTIRSKNAEFERLETKLSKTRLELAQTSGKLSAAEAKVGSQAAELRRLEGARLVTFKGKEVPIKDAAQETVTSIRNRTVKTSTANATATFGESIPFYGIGVIVAATSFEVGMACADMKDLYALQVALDPESAVPEDRDKVCGLKVPTRKEIWAAIKSSPTVAWDMGVNALDAADAQLARLPKPNFSGVWETTIGIWDGTSEWFGSWLD